MEPEEKTLDDFNIKDGDSVIVWVQKVNSTVMLHLGLTHAGRPASTSAACS